MSPVGNASDLTKQYGQEKIIVPLEMVHKVSCKAALGVIMGVSQYVSKIKYKQ